MMEFGQAILSMLGREQLVQTHFGKLANAAAILGALSERVAPENADWLSHRLDGFLAHVVNESASDARKLYDAIKINSFKGEKKVSIYVPKIVDKKLDISEFNQKNFYNICSIIDHSFRISVYSTLSEIIHSSGGSKTPKANEKLIHFRAIIGESKKEGFYLIELTKYVELLEPFLNHCQEKWQSGNLKKDPQGNK